MEEWVRPCFCFEQILCFWFELMLMNFTVGIVAPWWWYWAVGRSLAGIDPSHFHPQTQFNVLTDWQQDIKITWTSQTLWRQIELTFCPMTQTLVYRTCKDSLTTFTWPPSPSEITLEVRCSNVGQLWAHEGNLSHRNHSSTSWLINNYDNEGILSHILGWSNIFHSFLVNITVW